jgi:hypothetical protein
LIQQLLAKPEENIGFKLSPKKAATEMEERVDVFVPYGCVQHSYFKLSIHLDKTYELNYAFDLGLNSESNFSHKR